MKLDRLMEERWYLQPGAHLDEVRDAEMVLGETFPDDYVELITWSNGGDFRVGDRYFRLWSIEDVILRNARLDVQADLPGTVAIGGDAGEILYLLDYRMDRTRPRFIEAEGDNMCFGGIVVHAASLTAAFYAWSGLENARRSFLQCLAARSLKIGP
jgi:hypothetical protein